MEPSEIGSSKWSLGLRFIWLINERTVHFYRSGKTKEKDFEFLGPTDCGKANIRRD